MQSVKGKVVIDCFRLINPQLLMLGHEPRQTTSNVGHQEAEHPGAHPRAQPPPPPMVIDYRKNEPEEQMLTNP